MDRRMQATAIPKDKKAREEALLFGRKDRMCRTCCGIRCCETTNSKSGPRVGVKWKIIERERDA